MLNKNRIFLTLWCYAAWFFLNWPPTLQALVIGIPVAYFVAALTGKIPVGVPSRVYSHPKRFLFIFFWYIPVFVWENLKANLDVAYRVLHPGLPIKPAIVRVKTTMKTDAGLTMLANSISLVPGTTTVDVEREKGLLYVHCMAVSETDVDGVARRVVQKFERILKKIFEEDRP